MVVAAVRHKLQLQVAAIRASCTSAYISSLHLNLELQDDLLCLCACTPYVHPSPFCSLACRGMLPAHARDNARVRPMSHIFVNTACSGTRVVAAQVEGASELMCKVSALMRRLVWLRDQRPAEKSLVFSQWSDALEVNKGWDC